MISNDDWRPADGLTLEPNALRAARETSHCLALTAGPGAGKTEMLAQRADFLLRTGTCRYPKRILAISFKVDASKNLKERVYRRCGSGLASRFDSHTFHAFAKRIIDRFRPVLQGLDALDVDYTIGTGRIAHRQIEFADLVPLAIQILEDFPMARNAIRQSYTDVFLDEFQDCTDLQYKLVEIAFKHTNCRLVAVGDTKQKIMGWAGAMEGIFEVFVQDFNAVPLNMYRNFRSLPKLLRMQNDIIRRIEPASVMPDEQLAGTGGEVQTCHFMDSNTEAAFLADAIATWVKIDHVPLSEIAVLVSKQPDQYAYSFMQALSLRGIQYRNEQHMQDLSAEPAARLVVDYLLCLLGRNEPRAWIGLMELLAPLVDEEEGTLVRKEIHDIVKEQRRGLADSHLEVDWWKLAEAFLAKVGPERIVSLSPDYESPQRLQQVLQDTKTRIGQLLSVEPVLSKSLANFSDDQAIRILTIHKCKGLEFDSVIFMAIDNEIFFGDLDVNRCAFFVGVSRAKRKLILTFADRRDRPPEFQKRWEIGRTRHREFWEYAAVSGD